MLITYHQWNVHGFDIYKNKKYACQVVEPNLLALTIHNKLRRGSEILAKPGLTLIIEYLYVNIINYVLLSIRKRYIIHKKINMSHLREASIESINTENSDSLSRSQSNNLKTKTKSVLTMNEDALNTLTDEHISTLMKSSVKSIELVNKQLWKLFDEKRIITLEFLRRHRSLDNSDSDSISNITNENAIVLRDKCKTYNEFMKAFVDSVEIDNSLTLSIISDAIQQYTYLSSLQSCIENEKSEYSSQESLNNLNEIEEETKISLLNEIQQHSKILQRLNLLTPDTRMQESGSIKGLYDYLLDNLQHENDDLMETSHILKKCVYNQTKIITELTCEISHLKDRILEQEESLKNVNENNIPASKTDTKPSYGYGIEPLSRACALYAEEFKKSLKTLENLVNRAKDASITNETHANNVANKSYSLNNSSQSFEEDLYSVVEMCTFTDELLVEFHKNTSTTATSGVNGVTDDSRLSLSLKNIEMIKSKVQHILAQLFCDESTV